MATHETIAQWTARKQRERNSSLELDRVPTSSELFQIDRQRAQTGGSTDTGNSIRQLYGNFQLDSVQQQAEARGGGGLFSSFGAFASKITQPLIDIPDLPGPLNIIEEGIEELSSPIGLASALLIPFTGGTSLGLRGAAGVAAQLGSRAAAEVVVGGAAVGAASLVNARLPDNTPGVLRLIANVGAGGLAGGALSTGIRRTFANNAVDSIVQSVQNPAARKLSGILVDTPDLIRQNTDDLTKFRGEQFKAFDNALGTTPFDESGFHAAKRALRGTAERSGDAALDQSVRIQFLPKEIDELYGELFRARSADVVDLSGLLSAESGLAKLLTKTVPQQAEWNNLDLVFGTGLRRSVEQAGKSAGRQALDITLDLANVPRALAASMDMSAPLRQGIMLIGHPKAFTESFGTMVKAFFDDDFASHVTDTLTKGPRARALKQAGVEITDFRPGSLTRHEEQFVSAMIHNVPGLGVLTRASERAYTVFLNQLRADTFDSTLRNWKAAGKVATAAEKGDLAKFVNFATGRGNAKFLQGTSGQIASAAFFSPKFLTSRFQAPALLFTATPAVRKQVAKDLGIFIGTGVGVLSLLKASGVAEVEIDPRSSDFGKGHIGNTRFDFWGGYQQIVRYSTQAIMNERKSSATGEIVGLNRAETIGRFFQSKLSPPAGLAVDATRGETIIGEPLDPDIDTFTEQAIARTLPFFMQDVREAFTHSGMLVGAATVPASFFGVGSTSYSSTTELIQKYGLDTAEPHERLTILAENPELAQELVQRREISAERGSEAAQRGLDAEEIRERFTLNQEAADSMMLTGELTPGQWREQRKILSTAERSAVQTIFRDLEPGPETPLTRYFAAIEAATDASGRVDWDQVDVWQDSQPPSDQAFVERNTGLRDTELERAYKDTLSGLDAVGFFDITDQAWAQLAPAAGLSQATYQDWRRETLNELAQRFVQGGMDQGLARQEAERRLATNPIQKAYGDRVNFFQQQFVQQEPQLAREAASWELFSTTIGERQFLSAPQ